MSLAKIQSLLERKTAIPVALPPAEVPFMIGKFILGRSYWRSNKARARLVASKDCLEIVSLKTKHKFERGIITGIQEFRGPLWSSGIQIVHKLPGYPPFVVFTVFPPKVLPVLLEGLKKYGYKVAKGDGK